MSRRYTHPVPLTLDPQLEQRIHRKLDLGRFKSSQELLAHALDLIDAEEEWDADEIVALNESLDRSMASIERGEGIPGDQVRAVLARQRAESER